MKRKKNQDVWAPMTRSSFQWRIRGILSSILRSNNACPVCIPLCKSRICRSPLVGQKPMRKPKQNKNNEKNGDIMAKSPPPQHF